ncbi:hypothetical protein K466DRAFT_571234, partial [Polyporus arcularius HHB13444]
ASPAPKPKAKAAKATPMMTATATRRLASTQAAKGEQVAKVGRGGARKKAIRSLSKHSPEFVDSEAEEGEEEEIDDAEEAGEEDGDSMEERTAEDIGSEDEADTASVAGTEDEDEAEYATPRKNVERTPKASRTLKKGEVPVSQGSPSPNKPKATATKVSATKVTKTAATKAATPKAAATKATKAAATKASSAKASAIKARVPTPAKRGKHAKEDDSDDAMEESASPTKNTRTVGVNTSEAEEDTAAEDSDIVMVESPPRGRKASRAQKVLPLPRRQTIAKALQKGKMGSKVTPPDSSDKFFNPVEEEVDQEE